MNIPNILTSFRILMIPVFVAVFYLPVEWNFTGAALIFAIAGWTDWFDGYIARRFNMTSPLGAFLDPVADKLMVVISIVLIVELYETPWIAVPALVIIGREITITALREWMAEYGKRADVKVSFIGKVKTLWQLGAIFFLILGGATPALVDVMGYSLFVVLGYFSLYVSVALTLWSMYIYIKAAWPYLTAKEL
ncbi:CDP-diacylglycerol--glycerol-3-phosphate 3-phosphatidyltransferase [Pleionea litopenaei]|uniref:CDP-diacylglycerol--glycerol-3-phosphate 3-phosphatidyltransferase n=1 Tax=Pleionea litopenaei TaxID=3070815 RepID=A0AA51X7M8_9GAMM|nr:CDP-diacylglycerol--glycerol-3-phosphate 3-phosphatidyltransferase [Pleionea sp. HL-JVS1]WMS88074.1 CDP-diacylglycerol--glycerol-3-phosphate 3-phosphatidyltransferase [Pleionea sp. HL-JVS1]